MSSRPNRPFNFLRSEDASGGPAAVPRVSGARLPARTGFVLGRGIKPSDRVSFTYNLGRMLQAGLPLVQALQRLQLHVGSSAFRAVVAQMREHVQSGHTLAEALAQHPRVFDEFYVQAIEVGERSGKLDLVFERLTELHKSKDAIRKRMLGLLIYPCFVLLVLAVVGFVFVGMVLPVVLGAIGKARLTLPEGIHALILIRDYWYLLALGSMAVLGGCVMFFNQTSLGCRVRDEAVLLLPYVNGLVKRIQASHFLHSLQLAYEAGLPMDVAVTLSMRTIDNDYLRESFECLLPQVEAGEPLAVILSQTDMLPGMVLENIAIGEESGQLGKALKDALDLMTVEVHHRIDILLRILQPAAIIFLAVVLGGFLLLFYTSIFGVIGAAVDAAMKSRPF